MSFTLRDKTEIKIFILYLLMNLNEPFDFVTLHDMVVQDGAVMPFDFCECFFELAETEALKKTDHDGKEYFTVTEAGMEAAKLLESDLPQAMRERALRSASRYLQYCRRGNKITSEVTDAGGGKYRLTCKCSDKDGDYMDISVLIDDKRRAELMKYNFDDRTELIYRGLLSLLSGDVNYLSPAPEIGSAQM